MSCVLIHEMRPDQIRAAREACPVAYLPMGVLEWHGLHNPLGLDAVKATAMAERFARSIGGLVMPTMWWGDHRAILAELVFDANVSGNIDHRAEIMRGHGLSIECFQRDAQRSEAEGGWELFRRLLNHSLHEIATLGFKVIVTISGHYPLAGPAGEVGKDFTSAGHASVIPIIGYDLVRERYKGDHAAKWETSLMLSLRPELVDLSRLDPDPEHLPAGVLGEDPRTYEGHIGASAQYGEMAMNAMIEALRERVHSALGAL